MKSVTLKDQIREMILSGKRGNHPDFEPFFNIFGRDRIIALALEIKAEEKEKDESESKEEI